MRDKASEKIHRELSSDLRGERGTKGERERRKESKREGEKEGVKE